MFIKNEFSEHYAYIKEFSNPTILKPNVEFIPKVSVTIANVLLFPTISSINNQSTLVIIKLCFYYSSFEKVSCQREIVSLG